MDYTAEAFDQMQRLWGAKGFNDHNMHCVLRFEHRLDADILKRAVIASIEAFPILGTRYIGGMKPHWRSLDPTDWERAFLLVEEKEEFEEFVVSKADEGIGPQITICLCNSMPSSVALKMNHMICDAADFKTYLYFLCRAYTQGMRDPGNKPRAIAGDRSVRCILKCFGLGTRLKSLLLQSNQNNVSGGASFPLSESGRTRPFIVTRKLGRERVLALEEFGRSKRATLNDVMLTALYRSLFRLLGLRPGALLRIPVMADMRRYLAEKKNLSSLTNLTSTVNTQLECRPAERFEETLSRVKTIMDHRKHNHLGLNGFIKLDRVYRILGNRIANRLLMSRLKHPLISMTNMGILDAAQLLFGEQRPYDAFMCGSIKYRPYFQLAISSFDGELTLAVSLLGSDEDRDRISSFLDEIEAELPNVSHG